MFKGAIQNTAIIGLMLVMGLYQTWRIVDGNGKRTVLTKAKSNQTIEHPAVVMSNDQAIYRAPVGNLIPFSSAQFFGPATQKTTEAEPTLKSVIQPGSA